EKAHAEQHDRGEPDRVERDDSEREVDRRGDLAVGDGEERPGVELAAKAGKLARHYIPLLRARYRRPAPRPTKSSPMRIPTWPPPAASVRASSATPSTISTIDSA